MTIPEIIDAEIIVSAAEARSSIDRAKGHALGFWQEVRWQVENHAWDALGYPSLDAMWDAEYASLSVGIARTDRPELVAAFRGAGQTQQQIAEKLGVAVGTVNTDLKLSSENEEAPATVTNSRGQERPASYAPRSEPPPDLDREAGFLNDLRLYINQIGSSKETRALSPAAKQHLIGFLREAADTIEETL